MTPAIALVPNILFLAPIPIATIAVALVSWRALYSRSQASHLPEVSACLLFPMSGLPTAFTR
jgi:hypothetical protein